MSNQEKILIQSFRKFVSTALHVPEKLSKICPSSYKHKIFKLRQRKFYALNNRKVISSFEKFVNCKYLLTEYNNIYEIWMIECERIGLGEIQTPILYKIM